jgi:hypothetical protein
MSPWYTCTRSLATLLSRTPGHLLTHSTTMYLLLRHVYDTPYFAVLYDTHPHTSLRHHDIVKEECWTSGDHGL